MANEIMNTNNNGICTITGNDVSSKLAVLNALNGALALSEYIDVPFELVGIITKPGERSVSGEPCTNTYLLAADGKAYFSQSDGVARNAEQIADLFTEDGVFTLGGTGAMFKCIEVPLKNGRSIKRLVPHVE